MLYSESSDTTYLVLYRGEQVTSCQHTEIMSLDDTVQAGISAECGSELSNTGDRSSALRLGAIFLRIMKHAMLNMSCT